jgi:hypothetical protein
MHSIKRKCTDAASSRRHACRAGADGWPGCKLQGACSSVRYHSRSGCSPPDCRANHVPRGIKYSAARLVCSILLLSGFKPCAGSRSLHYTNWFIQSHCDVVDLYPTYVVLNTMHTTGLGERGPGVMLISRSVLGSWVPCFQ